MLKTKVSIRVSTISYMVIYIIPEWGAQHWRKELDLGMKLSACVGVKLGEGKNIFIEDNISGNIYPTSGNIEAVVPFMR
jgi:hypothetical protein